jgi:hypothetical protein
MTSLTSRYQILDKHTIVFMFCLKKTSKRISHRRLAPLRHIILILSQPVFLLNAACLAEKQQIPILKSLVLPHRGSNPRSSEANMLTIMPPILLFLCCAWKRLLNASHIEGNRNCSEKSIHAKQINSCKYICWLIRYWFKIRWSSL